LVDVLEEGDISLDESDFAIGFEFFEFVNDVICRSFVPVEQCQSMKVGRWQLYMDEGRRGADLPTK